MQYKPHRKLIHALLSAVFAGTVAIGAGRPLAAQGLAQDFWVGRAAYQVGHYQSALDHWQRQLARQPGDQSLHYWIGKAYHQLGRREDALRYWQPLVFADHRDATRELGAIQAETATVAGFIRSLDEAGNNGDALGRLVPELGKFISRTPDPRSRQRARFLLAVALERQGDAPGALRLLGPLAEEYAVMGPALLARIARDYVAQQQYDAAAATYLRLLKLKNDPRWFLGLAQAQEQGGHRELAVATRRRLLRDFPDSSEADQALWAEVEATATAGQGPSLRAYMERFPAGRFAATAVARMRALPPGSVTLADHFLVGQRALRVGQNAVAISELSFCADRGYHAADAWRMLGEAYKESGDTSKAIQVWQKALPRFAAGQLYLDLGQAYLERRQFGPGLEAFQQVVKRYPALAGEALWNIARILDRQSKDQDKNKAYQQLYQHFPQSDRATSATWRSFWADYEGRHIDSAAAKANHFLRFYPDSSLRPAFQFWLARIEMSYGHRGRAQELVNQAVAESPLSYYSLRLQAGAPVTSVDNQQARPPKPNPNWQLPQVSDEVDGLLGRSQVWPVMAGLPGHLQELLLLHQYDAVVAELGGPKSVASRWLKSVLYYKMGQYYESIGHAQGSTDPALLPLAYPLAFRDAIISQAGANNLNPLLVAALIREESRFKPEARSYVGAQGLMQLMPGTGRTLAVQAGIKDLSHVSFYDPKVNIALGCRYLGNNIRLFGGRTFLAVAGYNAGTGAVRGWLEHHSLADPDEFIENIPYTETRDYVKKVFASYWMYQRVYN